MLVRVRHDPEYRRSAEAAAAELESVEIDLRELGPDFESEETVAVANAYGDPFCAELTSRFAVPPQSLEVVRRKITRAGWLYRSMACGEKKAQPFGRSRAVFASFAKACREMEELIQSLPPFERDLYLLSHWEATGSADSEATCRRALAAIVAAAERARALLPARKGGPRPHTALFWWMKSVGDCWTDTLGRDFTFWEYQSEGMTPAFDFSVFLMRPLDPAVTPSMISSAMRKVRAWRNGRREPRTPELLFIG